MTKIDEVLIQTKRFSRVGFIEDKDLDECFLKLKKSNKTLILDWNTLVKDSEIEVIKLHLLKVADKIDVIRFLDPGVGLLLKEILPQKELHFSMEFGNFNAWGIKNWVNCFNPQLTRIILSNQLPLAEIRKIDVDIEIEIQGCGRIELFYSPRKLIHRSLNQSSDSISLLGASEDRPTQISPLIENDSGTFMFYDKDLFILDGLSFEDICPDYIRLELYHLDQFEMLAQTFPEPGWVKKLAKTLTSKTTRGFYRVNKSHAPLQRLTNKHIKKESEAKVGVILESVKKQHMIVEILKELMLPAQILFCSPEGKQVESTVRKVENLSGTVIEENIQPGYYKLPWIKHVVPASVLRVF
ncbi:MAG: hypothetical protein HOD92_18770 [Deltaproteobacteria bacterium]|nr:hypothetical protein [Deltaproteobacteria bacterium]